MANRTVTNERIRELRDRWQTGNQFKNCGPFEVGRTSDDMVSILNEVLEYRDAEEQAEQNEMPNGERMAGVR